MAKFIWQAGVFTDAPLFAADTATEITVIDTADDSLASLWKDEAGTRPLSNSHFLEEPGHIVFYVNPGKYSITAENGAFVQTWENEIVVDPDAGGGGGGGGTVDSVVAGNGIAVDDSDAANPIVSSNFSVDSTSSSYTLSEVNEYQWMEVSGASAKNITVPLDSSFNPGGKFIHIITNLGAGALTITKGDPGVELIAPPGGSTIIPQNATVGLKKASGVGDTYIIFGVTEAP